MSAAIDRLTAWRSALSAAAGEARLAQRLRFLDWSESEALTRLGGDELFHRQEDPAAVDLLERGLFAFESGGGGIIDEQAPFAEVFSAFSQMALGGLPMPGTSFFRSALTAELCEIAAPSLLFEFRASTVGGLVSSSETYRDFIDRLQAGGLRTLFACLPVLARLLGSAMRSGRETAGEFFTRLESDREQLGLHFPGAEAEIANIETDLGDAHRGGRRVMIVTFASGRKVVYKPRGLRMDVAWHGLLGWLGERNARCTLRAPFAIDRGAYGWVEFVEAGQPENPAEYYRRAGELLALAWLCGGSDFHEENLIATPHGPVLIDLETLFTPVPRPFGATDAELGAAGDEAIFGTSVLSTMLLPVWQIDEQGNARDLSGMTGSMREGASWHEPQWVDLGTSRMRQEMRATHGRQPHNIPRDSQGALIAASGFVEEVADGFRTAARVLLAERESLPLADFCGAEIRFLVRNTQVYGVMNMRLRAPKYLASAVDRSIELEKLSRPFFPLDPTMPEPMVFRCYEAERRGLENGDIPVFHGRTDETTLQGDGGIDVPGYFWKTGWQLAQQKLYQLSEAAIAEQAAFVRSSLQLSYSTPISSNPGDWLGAATEIADDIAARAIPLQSGGISWLSLGFDPLRKMQNSGLMGMDLYSGSTGVAIFLAAIARVTGEDRWRELAIESTKPRLIQMRRENARPFLTKMPLGIGSGLGSLIYGCHVLACLLGDDEYLDDARFFAELVRVRGISTDDVYDVLGGAAGAIIALLNLYEETKEVSILETASTLGNAVLAQRASAPSGQRVWTPSFAERPLTGLGHGAAGFAWALSRLGAFTGESRFADAASEAVAYERAVFDSEAANWPDFRRNASKSGAKAFMHGWCAGGPGVGLARLAQFGGGDAAANDEIDVAIQDALHGKPLPVAHLCCGQSARIEFLLEASRLHGKAALLAEAGTQASQMIETGTLAGFFQINGADHGRLFAPSFFQGRCGIGYTFLRLMDETLPSVASFQTGFLPRREAYFIGRQSPES